MATKTPFVGRVARFSTAHSPTLRRAQNRKTKNNNKGFARQVARLAVKTKRLAPDRQCRNWAESGRWSRPRHRGAVYVLHVVPFVSSERTAGKAVP